MINYFIKLFKYNEWANNQVLEIMLKEPFNDEVTVSLFSHIVAAQRMWLDRILNKKNEYGVWETYTLEACIALSKESSAAWIRFVERLKEDDLSQIISYTNTKGIAYENSVEDILAHVVNHSSYHRGQIAKQLRKADVTPPVTDYIHYIREGESSGNIQKL